MSDVKVIDDGGPAFPRVPTITAGLCVEGSSGMSLRDYCAAAVIQGMYSCQDFVNEVARMSASKDEARKTLAEWSYMQADAMLAARSA